MSLIEASSVNAKTMADGTLRLTFDVHPSRAQDAFKLFGSPGVQSAIARVLTPTEKNAILNKHAEKQPNRLAEQMVRDGYFRNPKLWLAMHDNKIWTMQRHKEYVQTLDCCGHAFTQHQCSGDIVLHHTDQAGDQAGGKRQPEAPQKGWHFLGVPVCHTYHTHIHNKATREEKYDLRTYAIQLTADKMKERMKVYLHLTSLAELTEEMKRQFESEIGL